MIEIRMKSGDVFGVDVSIAFLELNINKAKENGGFMYLLEGRYVDVNSIESFVEVGDGSESEERIGTIVRLFGEGLFEDEYWTKTVKGWIPCEDGGWLSDEEFDLDHVRDGDVNYHAEIFRV